jgi:hypothetical protein
MLVLFRQLWYEAPARCNIRRSTACQKLSLSHSLSTVVYIFAVAANSSTRIMERAKEMYRTNKSLDTPPKTTSSQGCIVPVCG